MVQPTFCSDSIWWMKTIDQSVDHIARLALKPGTIDPAFDGAGPVVEKFRALVAETNTHQNTVVELRKQLAQAERALVEVSAKAEVVLDLLVEFANANEMQPVTGLKQTEAPLDMPNPFEPGDVAAADADYPAPF